MLLYAAQLVANGLWSWLFFVWQLGTLSVIEIALLWVALWFTLLRFSAYNRLAGALLLPYLLWVSFATVLTVACWHLNPDIL
jgi:tryptophan-rich sensory protein